MPCPTCGEPLPEAYSEACPGCGARFDKPTWPWPEELRDELVASWVVIGVMLAVVVFGGYALPMREVWPLTIILGVVSVGWALGLVRVARRRRRVRVFQDWRAEHGKPWTRALWLEELELGRKQRELATCPGCGYDLTGSGWDRCPECGCEPWTLYDRKKVYTNPAWLIPPLLLLAAEAGMVVYLSNAWQRASFDHGAGPVRAFVRDPVALAAAGLLVLALGVVFGVLRRHGLHGRIRRARFAWLATPLWLIAGGPFCCLSVTLLSAL